MKQAAKDERKNVNIKFKSKLIPVAKIHTACLILTNFDTCVFADKKVG